jgi:acetylornithine/succinyldiaminopimelate/putrescine aminotransferase
MDVFEPGDHGSTFGGNPLGAAVALAAIRATFDELGDGYVPVRAASRATASLHSR